MSKDCKKEDGKIWRTPLGDWYEIVQYPYQRRKEQVNKLYPPIGRRRIESALIRDMIDHMGTQPDNGMYPRDEVIRWLKLWLPKNIYKKYAMHRQKTIYEKTSRDSQK